MQPSQPAQPYGSACHTIAAERERTPRRLFARRCPRKTDRQNRQQRQNEPQADSRRDRDRDRTYLLDGCDRIERHDIVQVSAVMIVALVSHVVRSHHAVHIEVNTLATIAIDQHHPGDTHTRTKKPLKISRWETVPSLSWQIIVVFHDEKGRALVGGRCSHRSSVSISMIFEPAGCAVTSLM
jgi:hypothetical protein